MNRIFRLFYVGIFFIISSFSSLLADDLVCKVFDYEGKMLFEESSSIRHGKAEVILSFDREFQEGDHILVMGANYLFIQADDSISGSYVYAPGNQFNYTIPIKERGQVIPGSAFAGKLHQIKVRSCSPKEWFGYRNIALNSFDIRGVSPYYPHATSNSEYGNESVFAAKNAIDGKVLNQYHGKWPYQSWGPDKNDSLWFKIDFGKQVEVDKIVLVNRAQFFDNHDSSWQFAKIEFSDGSTEKITMEKTHIPQEILIKRRNTSYIKFLELKPFEDLWCSWVEVEVWGNYEK
jgi:hypothetical protein